MSRRQLSTRGRFLVYMLYGTVMTLTIGYLASHHSAKGTVPRGVVSTVDQHLPGLVVEDLVPTAAGATLLMTAGSEQAEDEGRLERRTGSGNGGASSQPGSSEHAGSQAAGSFGAGEVSGADPQPGPVGRAGSQTAGSSDGDAESVDENGRPKLSLQVPQYHREFPHDVADIQSISTLREGDVESKGRHRTTTKGADAAHMRGLTKQYFYAGEHLDVLFDVDDEKLPENSKSTVPEDARPEQYGYSHSKPTLQIPPQLNSAIGWLASERTDVESMHDVLKKITWPVSTWEHRAPEDEDAGSTGTAPTLPSSPVSPEHGATNAKFQTVVLPESKLLVVIDALEPDQLADAGSPFTQALEVPPSELHGSHEPSPTSPTLKKVTTGLSDTDLEAIPMRHASDFWYLDWTRACRKDMHSAASLTYILIAEVDKASMDSLYYVAGERQEPPAEHLADVVIESFPGHYHRADTTSGLALLGTPAVSKVARLLIQHKDLFGANRAVFGIRFWRTRLKLPGGGYRNVHSMLVTLQGVLGYRPVTVHQTDASSSEESAGEEAGPYEEPPESSREASTSSSGRDSASERSSQAEHSQIGS